MNPMQQLQADAVEAATNAKREHEIDDQTRKVTALAERTYDRLRAVEDLVGDLRYKAGRATDEPLYVGAVTFGHDGETLDAMLAELAGESQTLDAMRVAKEKTDELTADFKIRFAELDDDRPGEAEVFAMPTAGGQYL